MIGFLAVLACIKAIFECMSLISDAWELTIKLMQITQRMFTICLKRLKPSDILASTGWRYLDERYEHEFFSL